MAPHIQICSRRTKGESSQSWADKQHNEEEWLVASPVKTRRTLANSIRSTTGDDISSSADFSQTDPCFIGNGQEECEWGGSRYSRNTRESPESLVYLAPQALQDRALLSKIWAGDTVAIAGVCHLSCLNQLYKKPASHLNFQKIHDQEMGVLKQRALSKLWDFAETFRGNGQPYLCQKPSKLSIIRDRLC